MSGRKLIPGVAAALALVVAGCGGSKPGASDTSGASLVRADALVFLAADSDFGSSQWQQVDKLSQKFPGREKAIERIEQSLQKDGVDFKRDVKPGLGSEFDIAIVPGPTLQDIAVVGLTKPDDADKFKKLVEKANSSSDSGPAVYRELDNGWFAISDTRAHIDQALKGNGKQLSDESAYKDALAKLPSDALATAYVNGAQLAKLIQKLVEGRGNGLAGVMPGLENLDYVSASLSAEHDGLRLHGAAGGSGSQDLMGGSYESKLISGVPADALAFLTFRGGKSLDQLKTQLETNPTFSQVIPQTERALGVRVEDILALLRGETALYVRPGGAIPEISLVLSASDQSSALATLDRLAARLGALTGAKVTSGREGGHKVKTIDFTRFAVRYAGLGDRILLTSGLNGVGAYTGSGPKLKGAPHFKEAKAAAGMPSSNTGFDYIDLQSSVTLIESLAGLSGSSLPADVTENLKPLRSFLAWGGHSGNAATFDAFLEIK
jgi:hypothetical protein